jgi:tetratricopeptide (TPR) repeat protein
VFEKYESLKNTVAALRRPRAVALSTGGYALAYVAGELEEGAAFIDRALSLNPNLALARFCSACVKIYTGEPELAIKDFTHSMRLSPLDPFINMAQSGIGLAHFVARRYEEALSWARRALQETPNYHPALRVLAASSAMEGRLADAQKAIVRLLEIDPDFRVSDLRDLTPLQRSDHFARYVEALRKAGLQGQGFWRSRRNSNSWPLPQMFNAYRDAERSSSEIPLGPIRERCRHVRNALLHLREDRRGQNLARA